MKITAESHLDHNLNPEHLAFIAERFGDRESFFLETVELPDGLADLQCGLYGPTMGDDIIPDEVCRHAVRNMRHYTSRLVALPPRPTRLLTVIGGKPGKDAECILYTAFGGPSTPREPGDTGIETEEGREESGVFWQDHALSDGGQREVIFCAEYVDAANPYNREHRDYVRAWHMVFVGTRPEKRTMILDNLGDYVELARFLGARILWDVRVLSEDVPSWLHRPEDG